MNKLPLRRASLAAIAVSSVLLASCAHSGTAANSHGSTTPSAASSAQIVDAEFISRANDVCRPYREWNIEHPNGVPIAGFDPNAPDPKILTQAAAWFDKVPLYRTFTPAFLALGPPRTATAGWAQLTQELERLQQDWVVQIEAARRGDALTWKRQYDDEGTLVSQISSDLVTLGFKWGDPCPTLFE